jgi:tRNA G18 (ribose-2'-O)-methylase SpoU
MRQIILIAHNLRSCHNVGSLLRTADGLGAEYLFLTGYTPYPQTADDSRMPHLAAKISRQIHKTALGAEASQQWRYHENIGEILKDLRQQGFTIAAIEQAENATPLPGFVPPEKIALLVGREVEGIEQEILQQMDQIIEIPMFGKKESFNVVQAAAMGLYHCTFAPELKK